MKQSSKTLTKARTRSFSRVKSSHYPTTLRMFKRRVLPLNDSPSLEIGMPISSSTAAATIHFLAKTGTTSFTRSPAAIRSGGGDGFDTVHYVGASTDYALSNGDGPSIRVEWLDGSGRSDIIDTMEVIVFNGDSYSLDVSGGLPPSSARQSLTPQAAASEIIELSATFDRSLTSTDLIDAFMLSPRSSGFADTCFVRPR